MPKLDHLLNYYTSAKRTALLAHDNLSRQWCHIFSVIELQPTEIPPYSIPTDTWKDGKVIRSSLSRQSNNYSFYLLVTEHKDTAEALRFFNEPFNNRIIDRIENAFFNSAFIQEPNSESPLVIPSNIFNNQGLAGILPKRNSGILAWAQIDHERIVETLFRRDPVSNEMRSMSQLTNDWLGFDIWTNAEHIGNIYLTAPNPYFRDISLTLSSDPIGIFYHIKFRKGIKEKLLLRFIDYHGDFISLDQTTEIQEERGFIKLPHEPQSFKLRVYNEHQELIYVSGPTTFIRSIQFGMSIKQADLYVSDGQNKKFVAEKFSSERPVTVGKPVNFNAAYYFKKAEQGRNHIQEEKNNEFIFFAAENSEQATSNTKAKAREIIRSLINSAKDTCFLVDPYFGSADLVEFAWHIKDSGVKIRILNRRGKNFVNLEKANAMQQLIEEYNSLPFQKIECRMLTSNILHDRFVIADTFVWFLGSSFSEFGKRSTCIAKVPQSSGIGILRQVEKWYFNNEYSETIDEYINSGDENA